MTSIHEAGSGNFRHCGWEEGCQRHVNGLVLVSVMDGLMSGWVDWWMDEWGNGGEGEGV